MTLRFAAASLLVSGALGTLGAQRVAPVTLESFDDTAGWRALPSDGVRLSIHADSGAGRGALRMDIDYQGHAGYAVARHPFALPPLPPYWAITLRVRGDLPPNTLELKLVDSSGLNVWWMRKLDLQVDAQWTELHFRPSDLTFAWGPLGGGPPRNIAAIEIAFTAGQGGRGWLALDDLVFIPLPSPVGESVRPRVIASSGAGADGLLGAAFARAPRRTDPLSPVAWRSTGDGEQTIALDFRGVRDLSALALDWGHDWATEYDIQRSDDGATWTTVRTVRGGAGGRRFIHLPDFEASWLRLHLLRSNAGNGYALRAIYLLSDSAAGTASAFLESVADASALGMWPRALTHQQSYWTVFGMPEDGRDGLMSEDGSIDTGPGKFSLEPFLYVADTLVTWADAAMTHALDGGVRPIPVVVRSWHDVALDVRAFATRARMGEAVFWARYRLINNSGRARAVRLAVAVRPVQVNPAWQFLGVPGGAADVHSIAWNGVRLLVNGTDAIVPQSPPSSVEMARFDAGLPFDRLRHATPDPQRIDDETQLASATLEWRVPLAAHSSADIWLVLPESPGAPIRSSGPAALDSARRLWDAEASVVQIDLPGAGASLAAAMRTALAHILVDQNNVAIEPGTRSYRRSWIRDGALISRALLKLGHASEVRGFLEYFAHNVFADGKVPCCIDARGADPVTENDADGELLYLAAEYWRMTGDTAAIRELWPTLERVTAHLDSLRRSRRTAQYRSPDSLFVFGLLPPSISHEGYSAKPAYSFWDDFWGVRGMADASLLARVAGDSANAVRHAAAAREFRTEVVAAVARSMAIHHIPQIPGAAELGDLDPTSTTIALDPAQLLGVLPDAAVRATFDTAWSTFRNRRDGVVPWDVYTPYEWRQVGSFIRLGQPERALALTRWFMSTRRPIEWNQWSEAIWHDLRAPKFIGDMPHAWVASDFIRSTLDLLAYERESDSTLVVGAGIPFEWARDPNGVTVRGLRTWWGALSLRVRPSATGVHITVSGARPPHGIELHAPFGRSPHHAFVNGKPAALVHGAVVVQAPANVELVY